MWLLFLPFGGSRGRGQGKGGGGTYVRHWIGGELDTLAIFDDGSAGAGEVDDAVAALVHAELAAVEDEHAVGDVGDVGGSVHGAADQQRAADAFDGEAGERLAVFGGNGDVDHALFDARQRGGHGGVGGGRRHDDVHFGLVGERDFGDAGECRTAHWGGAAGGGGERVFVFFKGPGGFALRGEDGRVDGGGGSLGLVVGGRWCADVVWCAGDGGGVGGGGAGGVVAWGVVASLEGEFGGVVERDGGWVFARGLEGEALTRGEGGFGLGEFFLECFDGLKSFVK